MRTVWLDLWLSVRAILLGGLVGFFCDGSLQAEVLKLKDGRVVEGRVYARTELEYYVQTTNGTKVRVPVSQVAAAALQGTPPSVAPTGAGAQSALPQATRYTRPSLEATIRGILVQLDPASGGDALEGVVVQVDADKVYIDLGASRGVHEGEEFEIVESVEQIKHPVTGKVLSEERKVAARLRVKLVQPELAVCEIVSGKAVQKNAAGDLYKVLPASVPKPRTARLGNVAIDAPCGISPNELDSALLAAASASKKLQLAARGADGAPMELRGKVTAQEGGAVIELALVDLASGAVLASARGTHKTAFSMAELGFLSAVSATVGAELKMPVIKRAMEGQFGRVLEAGEYLFIANAGPRGEHAWIFPQGRIVVCAKNELRERRDLAQIQVAWCAVAQTAAGVTAAIPKDGIEDVLRRGASFFTVRADQLQYLHVLPLPRNTRLVINWPDARSAWAELLVSARWNPYYSEILIDGKKVLAGIQDYAIGRADVASLQFGEHVLECNKIDDSSKGHTWGTLTAFFQNPNGRIVLYDESNKNIASSTAYSQAMNSLFLPMPGDLEE